MAGALKNSLKTELDVLVDWRYPKTEKPIEHTVEQNMRHLQKSGAVKMNTTEENTVSPFPSLKRIAKT
jgi:hypothetical protein